MTGTVVHLAGPADAATLSDLAARTFRQAYLALAGEADVNAYVQEYYRPEIQAREIADGASKVFIAHEDGTAVGFMHLVEENGATELKRIYVDQVCHGRGVGQRLLGEAIASCVARGDNRLWLVVSHLNHRAVAFYQKAGFEIVGKTELPPMGDFEDNAGLIMALPIP